MLSCFLPVLCDIISESQMTSAALKSPDKPAVSGRAEDSEAEGAAAFCLQAGESVLHHQGWTEVTAG